MFLIVWSFSFLVAAAFAGATACVMGMNHLAKKIADLIGEDRAWQPSSLNAKKSTTPSKD